MECEMHLQVNSSTKMDADQRALITLEIDPTKADLTLNDLDLFYRDLYQWASEWEPNAE